MNTKIRKLIENTIVKDYPEFKEISDPDFQYSGGKNNFKYHSYVKKYFSKDFDGTIIIDSEVDSEDLEGPTEIVLWKNFNTLIKKL
jgi:predicted TIM-barrel fold metal-dependent hydrolase